MATCPHCGCAEGDIHRFGCPEIAHLNGGADVKETPEKRRVGDGTPGPGRPKGSRNKTTTKLKEAILAAAEGAGELMEPGCEDGLVAYLTEQAAKNPGPFLSLLGKVLPLTLDGDADNPVRHEMKVIREVIYPDKRPE